MSNKKRSIRFGINEENILVYGHYNENLGINKKDFIKTVEAKGHVVGVEHGKFDPVFAGEEPSREVLDHRKRIEASDIIVLIAPIWNFRMPAIVGDG